jgi:DNA-binding LytR/AlgR family response regulator
MPTALIADDEANLRLHLIDLLAQTWPELHIVAECDNGLEAVAQIDALSPDVAFLDIKMPGLTGLEVAQSIAAPSRLVFVTAYDEFAVKAFEHQAVDYLLKPVNAERLARTTQRLSASLAQAEPLADIAALAKALRGVQVPAAAAHLRFVRASRGDTVYQVPVEEVLYFQSDNKLTVVQTERHEYVIRTTLAELIDQLNPADFAQVHRSTVVNITQVLSAQRDLSGNMQLRIKGSERPIAVARAYQGLFKQM